MTFRHLWRKFCPLALTGGMVLLGSPGFAEETEAVGRFDIAATDTGYRITATVEGRANSTIDAEMAILKNDTSGRIETRQSRKVETGPGTSSQVATSKVSMSDEGTIEATLTLSDDSGIVYRVIQRIDHEIPD